MSDVIEPPGLKLSGDTAHIVNTGAFAKAGGINKADLELPCSGGRRHSGVRRSPFNWTAKAIGAALRGVSEPE